MFQMNGTNQSCFRNKVELGLRFSKINGQVVQVVQSVLNKSVLRLARLPDCSHPGRAVSFPSGN
jgi:hypothetical protein